jgi:phosphatidylglycerol:prolipoprotein diacylglycerol transferase
MHPTIQVPGMDLVLPAYGVLMVLAVTVGLLVTLAVFLRQGQSPDRALDACLIGIACGVVGARLLGLAVEWRAFFANPLDALWHAGGLHFYGGFLGGVSGLWIWARKKGLDPWRLADWLAPGLLIGQAIGRIGCLLQGCCYGCRWDHATPPLGIVYPRIPDRAVGGPITGSPAYLDHLEKGWIHPNADSSLETVPVVLIESAFCLILFLEVLPRALRRQPSAHAGGLALIVILAYAIARFLLEFFRGDSLRGIHFGLSTSQWIALIIIAGVVLSWRKQRQPAKESASHPHN